MNYSFHPKAEKELEEIEKYYDNIRVELPNSFRAETEMTDRLFTTRSLTDHLHHEHQILSGH